MNNLNLVIVFVSVLTIVSPIRAASINWGEVQSTTSSAANDVADGGNVVLAINGHSQADTSSRRPPATVTLDGIVFESVPIRDFLGRTATDSELSLSSPNSTGDADYDAFLTHVGFADPAAAGLSGPPTNVVYPIQGLTAGTEYLLQAWYTDERPGVFGSSPRTAFLGDNEPMENAVGIPGEGDNGFGSFVVGTFTADETKQDLRIETRDTSRAHLTGLLVREVVPEPSSFSMVALMLLAVVVMRRRE